MSAHMCASRIIFVIVDSSISDLCGPRTGITVVVLNITRTRITRPWWAHRTHTTVSWGRWSSAIDINLYGALLTRKKIYRKFVTDLRHHAPLIVSKTPPWFAVTPWTFVMNPITVLEMVLLARLTLYVFQFRTDGQRTGNRTGRSAHIGFAKL